MESVSVFEERLAGGNRCLPVGHGAASVYRVSASKVERPAGQEVDCVHTKTLIDIRAENGRPALVPTRAQADALGFSRAGVTEEIGVIPDPKFMPRVGVKIGQ